MPHCLDDVNTTQRISFSISKLRCGPQKFNSKEIHITFAIFKVSSNKRGISVEKKRIHLNSDVFAALSVVAKAPYIYQHDTSISRSSPSFKHS